MEANDTTTASEPGHERWLEALSRAEIQELVKHRDLLSWLSVALDWGIVFGAMAMVAVWPNPLTIALAGTLLWRGLSLFLPALGGALAYGSLRAERV